ncbi:MAG: T9SS type A sorting domain-containing protein [bacterium]
MRYLITLTLFLIFFTNVVDAQSDFNLGVNLVDNGAFVNIINHTNRFQDAVSFDANGWPESDFKLVLMDGRPVMEWSNVIDDPEIYRVDYSGNYKCNFTGSADISLWGSGAAIENKIWDEQNNQTYFDLVVPGPPADNHGIVVLTFTNTARTVEGPTNRGITNLKVIRPGYELNTEKIFTDEYINLCKAADFSCYRFYNLQNIWSGEPEFPEKTLWSNRKTPNDVSQTPLTNINGKRDAWCWEYIIELANILDKDIWINIHISCDSNYVVSLAQMLKEQLNSGINIYVENSNEVWSPTHMTHGPYNSEQAKEYGIHFDENYARRTVELSKWFAFVFGENEINKRIRVILAGQHAYHGRSDTHLNYINNTFGPPKEFIYATSAAVYFGSSTPAGTVEEINEGMIEDINSQIVNSQVSTYRYNHISKAKNWELTGGCSSYEGGPGLPGGGSTSNLANQILANRTEKMGDIIKYNYLEGWKDIGGGLALYFTLNSGYNRYGCWGLTDDYTKPDRNYKMQAVRDIISTYTNADDKNKPISDFTIYPNPAKEYIEIKLLESSKLSESYCIKIYNILGECVLSSETFSNLVKSAEIDISGLTNGMYSLIIRNKNVIITERFVKLR